jgi:hypothetical protein
MLQVSWKRRCHRHAIQFLENVDLDAYRAQKQVNFVQKLRDRQAVPEFETGDVALLGL